MRHYQPSHIPDYQRLCDLTRTIPELEPDDVMTMLLLRSAADELTALLKASLDRYGITEGRLRVMGHLLDRREPATHSELAVASGVTKGTVTGLIDGLERDGHVRRLACEHDRRVSLIELTEEGERALKTILPGHLRRLSQLVGSINKDEQQVLMNLLEKVRTGLCEKADEPEPPAEQGA